MSTDVAPSSDNGNNGGNSPFPPAPQVPPGYASPVRNPHPHDVLSGRGGRINSHPGNVRFRSTVDFYKREYLDPRTKKVEKARISARIVASVRSLDPPGRFLKEDPHTGLWAEIGDERAWKKAGQALRESAPGIRAEKQAQRQAQLQMLMRDPLGAGISEGVGKSSGSIGWKVPQTDLSGPRHRSTPPENMGLGAVHGHSSNNDNYGDSQRQDSPAREKQQNQQQFEVEDQELARMQQEYLQLQRIQQEQQRRMQQYLNQLQKQHQRGGMGGMGSDNTTHNFGDVPGEYQDMQQGLVGSYRRQIHQEVQQRKGREQQQHQSHEDHQKVMTDVTDSGLEPVDVGSALPDHYQHQQQGHYAQQYQQDQQHFYHENNGSNDDGDSKTVSTISSFDEQSVDMLTSLDGFSWNQSAYSMSGLISAGNTQGGSSRHNNLNASSGNNTRKGKIKSKDVGKKVNEMHQKQQVIEAQRKMQQQQMHGQPVQGMMMHRDQTQQQKHMMQQQQQQQMMIMQEGTQHFMVATAGGGSDPQQQHHHRNSSSNHQHHNNTSMSSHKNQIQQDISLTSFGFGAINEGGDDITEASYKMSNLGLSEMDMTFASDMLSVRSNRAPKNTEGEREQGNDSKKKNRANYVAGTTNEELSEEQRRTSSVPDTSNASRSVWYFSMDDFQESFKSMEMTDRSSKGGGEGREDQRGHPNKLQQYHIPDSGGADGGGRNNPSSSHGKDTRRGGMPSTHSSSRGGGGSGVAATSHAESMQSMGLSVSDLDLLTSNNKIDFGASLESLASQSTGGSSAGHRP